MYKCPCCDQETLESRNENDICPICGWEDYWWDSSHPDELPTFNWVTLTQAREMFRRTGKNILQLQKEDGGKTKIRVKHF